MRRTKRRSTSPLRGVSLSSGNKWVAQYQAAGFYQRFESEMEAFAHFARVYVEFNGRGAESTTMLFRNRAWKARIPMENLVHHGTDANGKRYFQFPVDRDFDHVVKVDEWDYEKFKDMYWFVKDGRITGVEGFCKDGNKFHFYYEYLDLMIYRTITGRGWQMGKPIKLDGDEFNLVRRNLAPPPREGEYSIDLRKTGLFGPVPDPRQEERDSWEEENWLASLDPSYGLRIDQPSWGDEIAMPSERSRNMAPPPKEEETSFELRTTGLFGPVPDPRQEKRDSWEEESWLASFEQSYGKTSDQPSWGDEIAMPGERSEPGL